MERGDIRSIKRILKKSGWTIIPQREEVVRLFGNDIQKVIDEEFPKFDQARRNCWAQSHQILLD